MSAAGPVLWQPLRAPEEPAARLLFAAPHVGGGAAVARDLARALGPEWACFGLALPGRERRFAEDPQWTFEEVVTAAADALVDLAAETPDAQVVGIGQCSGAWLIHAILALAAGRLDGRLSLGVLVSQQAWHAPRVTAALPADSDELWQQLLRSGDTRPEIADDEEAREMLEPVVRADHDAVRDFPDEALALAAPLLVVFGSADASVGEPAAQEWARYGASVTLAKVPAGHLPLRDSPAAVAEALEHYFTQSQSNPGV